MASSDGAADGPGSVRERRAVPSMADVAVLAGVSTQTVSRVSTGNGPVRRETRRRVLAAMEQLGYAPNRAARALKYGTFRTIGVVAHRLDRTGESRTVEALARAARAAGYTVTLVDVERPSSDDVAAAVTRLGEQSVDGLVVIRAETPAPGALALPPRLPVVVSESQLAGDLPAVATDQAAGTRQAVAHLLALGHATVHHLAGPADSTPAEVRADAWRRALAAAGRPVTEPHRGDWSIRSGYQEGLRLAADPAVSAVFCANDEMALGLYRALRERGRRIPQDVSVVGFDDVPVAEFAWPPLTTVAQDFASVGEQLVALLLRQIEAGVRLADARTLLPAELVVRASTGPAPRTARRAARD